MRREYEEGVRKLTCEVTDAIGTCKLRASRAGDATWEKSRVHHFHFTYLSASDLTSSQTSFHTSLYTHAIGLFLLEYCKIKSTPQRIQLRASPINMAESDETPTQAKLIELTNEANLKYSLKNYNDAAELYSRATEMQGELRGDEMAPENAELLYLYGRCLYKVAVSNSDVLGGQVAGEKKAAPKKEKLGAVKEEEPGQKLAEEVVEAVVEEKEGKSGEKGANQPFFQLVDAEWSDEEEEEGEEDGEGNAQQALEEEDDFATAYEILDLARVLLERQLQATEAEAQNGESAGKGKAKAETQGLSPQLRQIKERLADTHDLQAEISLENERFDEAVTDFQSAAALKDELYPKASSIIAEAHYKLSLALEFESMRAVREAQAKEGDGAKVPMNEKPEVNEELREQARKETELAVESIKLRVQEEEGKLAGLEGTEAKNKRRDIEDSKEIMKEMEDRVRVSVLPHLPPTQVMHANVSTLTAQRTPRPSNLHHPTHRLHLQHRRPHVRHSRPDPRRIDLGAEGAHPGGHQERQ
jgi:HAT1-interacting factor 1